MADVGCDNTQEKSNTGRSPVPGDNGAAAATPDDVRAALIEAASCAMSLCRVPVAVCVLAHRGRVQFLAPPHVDVGEAKRCGLLALASAVEGRPLASPNAASEPGLAASPLLKQPTPVGLFLCVPVAGGTGPPAGAIAVLDHVPRVETQEMLAALNRIAEGLASRLESEGGRTCGAGCGEGGVCRD
jgi:GAF domain-containing protein